MRCPDVAPETFEGIPNCFIGEIDVQGLLPRNNIVSQESGKCVELIYEAAIEPICRPSVEIDETNLKEGIKLACDQYAANIAPERIEDRFQNYLTEDVGLSVDAAIELFRTEGITPFLVLKRIFVSEPHSTVCFDFLCLGEEYLDENGFSFDLFEDRVEFVTPRELMPEGSYPACRKT